jgi:hypothetical protein
MLPELPRQPPVLSRANKTFMPSPEAELIFPPRGIASLEHERGEAWLNLISTVENAGPDSPETMAFLLMLARLTCCSTCNTDSYRAMHGCIACAKQSLKRYHGTDEELNGLFEMARTEVEIFLKSDR